MKNKFLKAKLLILNIKLSDNFSQPSKVTQSGRFIQNLTLG